MRANAARTPRARRTHGRSLDDLLVASAPRYAGVRADHDRVLEQRDALLKTAFPALRRHSAPAGWPESVPGTRTVSGTDVTDARLRRPGTSSQIRGPEPHGREPSDG